MDRARVLPATRSALDPVARLQHGVAEFLEQCQAEEADAVLVLDQQDRLGAARRSLEPRMGRAGRVGRVESRQVDLERGADAGSL